jgi:drug/metabolite transporter (DMT)-like permease
VGTAGQNITRPAVKLRFSRLDALLVAMTVIWGSNYSLIKSALADIAPLAFNGVRLALASTIFLAVIQLKRDRVAISRHDWLGIVALAVIGQCVYQLLFISALARTSVANSSLIIACTPIFVALMTAALGHERVTTWQWAGTLLSAAGIYIVIGGGASVNRVSLAGDLMMLTAVLCWSASSVGARPLLARHSPLIVTGYSMAIGTVLYLPFAWPALREVAWRDVSARAWWAIGLSATFALCVAYMIWYTALQRIGNTRTSVYSNMVPIAAMLVAGLWLGEHIGAAKIAGAAAVLVGVGLTKVQPDEAPVPEPA